ncbi:hypothetical protein [Bacteroides ovatus]|jgi:hypothetical protein|uniref:hypothetical protein n=1 Tax=Bacteroides ovatus TaxID=28116 RepID=UPI00206920CF|nr:hypothetical protein [Bacteroides ovatus]UYI64324.1 MAG: hypothetical protein OGM04_02590 [Bacteroides ovatus]DAU81537.1 MAG TPA: Protein of unknown function (DUF2688) [Caudoviricetes sp.]
MKKTLNTREKEKLSRILQLDSEIIEKLSEHDILDTSACRAVIIRSEYQDIKSLGRYNGGHIVRALAEAYGLSRSAIDLIIYQKEPNKKCACTRCGNPVTRYKFARYGGLCDQCLVKQVNIE